MKTTILGVFLVILFADLSRGQQPPTPPPPQIRRANSLIGAGVAVPTSNPTTVIYIGKIHDLIFSSDGSIDFFIVITNERKLTAIPWGAGTIKWSTNPSAAVRVALAIDINALNTAPKWVGGVWPDFYNDKVFLKKLHDIYGDASFRPAKPTVTEELAPAPLKIAPKK